MSLSYWYHFKAEQCVALAISATDPLKRAAYLSERESWLAVAAQADLEEEEEEDEWL